VERQPTRGVVTPYEGQAGSLAHRCHIAELNGLSSLPNLSHRAGVEPALGALSKTLPLRNPEFCERHNEGRLSALRRPYSPSLG
jgi:hypothetical protein